MKRVAFFLFLSTFFKMTGHTQFACAGLDRVDIYLNNKLVATSTTAEIPSIKTGILPKPDTLVFHAFTDFEGLRNSTVDVKNDFGELLDHINSTNNTGYEATFSYVFDRSSMDDPGINSIDIFINLLCERDIQTEQVATLVPETSGKGN